MPNVQIQPPSGFGGLIQGNFGNYNIASDGTFTVDARDAATLIAQKGFNYMFARGGQYRTIAAPAAAAAGAIIASAACSNGGLTIAAQPNVPRQVAIRLDPGTAAVTAGQVSVTYVGNDNQTTVEVVSLATPASTILTKFLSKGMVNIATAVVSLMAGGASPGIQFDSTASISVPVDPGTVDVTFTSETVDTTNETVGTKSTATLGTIATTTAPNGTHNFTLNFNFLAGNA